MLVFVVGSVLQAAMCEHPTSELAVSAIVEGINVNEPLQAWPIVHARDGKALSRVGIYFPHNLLRY